MLQGCRLEAERGNVQKILSVPKGSSSPFLSGAEGKAAALLARGAYSQYVSTAKGRPSACAKRLRQSQGTPLAAFFNISKQEINRIVPSLRRREDLALRILYHESFSSFFSS